MVLEEGLILGETYNHMHFLFTGRWFHKWLGAGWRVIYKWQVGEGGLIISCLWYSKQTDGKLS